MHIARTTINLPLELISKVQKYLSVKTKTEAIVRSLQDIVHRYETLKLARSLAGRVPMNLTTEQLKKMRKNRL